METAAQQFNRFYFDALVVPGISTFVLFTALALLRKKWPNLSRWWLSGIFAIGFFWITSVPHLWRILFPEPCNFFQAGFPVSPCWFTPSAYLQLGIFAGVVGALLALLSLTIWRAAGKKLK